MDSNALASLRQRIAEIEERPFAREDSPLLLPFAIAHLDRMLAGGLRRNALHEICGCAHNATAATGFAAAILARLARRDNRPFLWVAEAAAAREAGLPYGAGLDRFGLDSRRLIIVQVRRPEEALWVFEEGLACRGLAAVLTEVRGKPRLLDLTASRRLALRARDGGVMGLMLRQSNQSQPSAAITRWLVAPRPAMTLDDYPAGIGKPAWHLTLERNRLGTTGVLDVEWDHGRCRFIPVTGPSHSLPVAAIPANRSHLAREPGTRMAFAQAS